MKYGQLLKCGKAQKLPSGGDFISQATSAGWLHSFAEGQWMYSGEYVQIYRHIQARYVQKIRQLGFEEWIFPRLIPRCAFDTFELSHYRPKMLFGVGTFEENGKYLWMLDPVQCISLYEHLRENTLNVEDLPIKIVECLGGWTWRNETTDDLFGPMRAREFSRVESVFIGSPDEVQDLRKLVEQEILNFLTELQLNWRTVVGIGCMEIESLEQGMLQATTEDETPIHDVEVLIDADNWLEIAGCTVEGTHLVDRFAIKHKNNHLLSSGCCGLGFNRLLACLFLQHGFNTSFWPQAVKQLCNLK